jgi:hypothetical protein
LRLLARRPEDRPQDAFAVVDSLNDVLRRYANPSMRPPHVDPGGPILLTASPDPPMSSPTLTERVSGISPVLGPQSHPTANIARMPTGEIAMRWSSMLAELEATIQGKAKERGGTFASDRAAELVGVAREMVPRVERAQRVVGEAQARVDRLEAEGRDFRANLGHAVDVLVHDRSRERAHLEALIARHAGMTDPSASAGPESIETSAWETAALAAELERAKKVDTDLTFQIEALQSQLESRNVGFEREMVAASGALEGSLSALRRLTNELVRTLDEAAVALGAERSSRPNVAS